MSLQQALAWIQLAQQLVGVGAVTVQTIRSWIQTAHSDVSEADLDAILDHIASSAAKHKALAVADAG